MEGLRIAGKRVRSFFAARSNAAEPVQLLDDALVQANILDPPNNRRPELLIDRVRQMKAEPIRQLCGNNPLPQ